MRLKVILIPKVWEVMLKILKIIIKIIIKYKTIISLRILDMYLIPLVRTNRAIAASLIYPENPVLAVAASEIVSVIVPLLNPKKYSKIMAHIIAFIYNPNFASSILESYQNSDKIYYRSEICFLLLFCITLIINKL